MLRNLIRFFRWLPMGLFLTVLFLLFTMVLIQNYSRSQEIKHQFEFESQPNSNFDLLVHSASELDLLVVDTPTCKIPQTDLMPLYYQNGNWNWASEKNKVPNCDQEQHFTPYVKLDEVIKITHPNPAECNLREIIRDPSSPTDVAYKEVNQVNITSRFLNVSALEMFVTECNGSYNFEANLPMKPAVENKTKFWKITHSSSNKQNGKESPVPVPVISVLWLGVDTTSRRHLQRSFPKSLKLLKEMGFIDFTGHHTINPKTLDNLIPSLMGYTLKESRLKCQLTRNDTFDPCPFIWKTFNAHNYVTMYSEDNVGTFYFGGFAKQPIDYYTHSLFLAQRDYMEKKKLKRRDCMSSETVPHFALRYARRFLQKFKKSRTPFFSFTWFGYPFHDFDFALSNADLDFEQFFLALKKDKQFLENTLIIFNADHGDRFGQFREKTVEGFLERSLIPLFLRIPENLIRKYPDLHLKEFAVKNSKLLTTPFDIHHTLLHVLHLCGLNPYKGLNLNINASSTVEYTFSPVLSDRSSLFVQIPQNRTCASVHIHKECCTCNLQSPKKMKHIVNRDEIKQLIDHAVLDINKQIENSRYKDKCVYWNASTSTTKSESALANFISAVVLNESESFLHVLLKFQTEPPAKFEIQLRIIKDGGKDVARMSGGRNRKLHIQTQGGLTRIESYLEQSWCVGVEDEKDKILKELCMCL